MEREDSFKLLKQIVIGILITVFIVYGLKSISDDNKLDKNGKLAIAKITSVQKRIRNTNILPEYEFKVGSKKYEGEFSESTFCKGKLSDNDYKNLNNGIWIIYLPKNPSVSRMISSKKEFNKFNKSGIKNDNVSNPFFKYLSCK